MVPAPLVDRRAEIPPLVSRKGAGAVQVGGRDHRAGHALHRPETRTGELGARRRRTAGARQYRHPHPADFVHRPPRGRGAGAAGADADRRPDHRRTLAGRYRAARCACAGTDAASPPRRRREDCKPWRSIFPTCWPKSPRNSRATRRRWCRNDVAVLDELFRNDLRTLRYGIGRKSLRL